MSLIRRRGSYKSKLQNPFIIQIDTSLGSGTSTFELPLHPSHTYDFIVSWGDGSNSHITSYNQSEATHSYTSSGIYKISMSGKVGGWSFSYAGDSQKVVSVDSFGNVGFEYLEDAFSGCINLVSIDAGVLDLSAVTSLSSFLFGCSSLTFVDFTSWDTSTITNFYQFMMNCSAIQNVDVAHFDMSDVTNMNSMFRNCLFSSIDVSSWDVGNLQTCSLMFFNCQLVQEIDTGNWDLSNLVDCASMFYFNFALTSYFDPLLWWNNSNIINFTNCFLNATNVSNYADIPNNWKGL